MKANLLLLTLLVSSPITKANNLDHIKEQMIKQSIRQYRGNCPCPYNTTSAGNRCGKRSAYSKPGGEEPLCYKKDIPDSTAKKFLPKNKQ